MNASDPDPRRVYAKTAAGIAEIAQRERSLSSAARRVLIVLDGRRRLLDLPPFTRPGELEPIIADLEARGLISLAGVSDASVEDAVRERARRERETLALLRQALAGAFRRELGAGGLVLEARLRDCVSLDVMGQLLREGVDTAIRHGGDAAGERLLAVIRPIYAEFARAP